MLTHKILFIQRLLKNVLPLPKKFIQIFLCSLNIHAKVLYLYEKIYHGIFDLKWVTIRKGLSESIFFLLKNKKIKNYLEKQFQAQTRMFILHNPLKDKLFFFFYSKILKIYPHVKLENKVFENVLLTVQQRGRDFSKIAHFHKNARPNIIT